MTSSKYLATFSQNLLPSVRKLKMKKNCTWIHDTNPNYTFKSMKKWLQKRKILESTHQSLYANPTGNLWDDLKRAVHRRSPGNVKESGKIRKVYKVETYLKNDFLL